MSRPASSSMHFVCRQCRYALRNHVPERRHFSSTASRNTRALPVFKPTSSPELDTLLTTIRTKYFLPQYLNSAQRKLIRSTKLRSQIENDPVFATLGDEEIRLEHIDVTKDMPSRGAFLEAIRLMEEGNKQDWQNLPGLLEGYHRSKVRLDPVWLGRMIAGAREADALSIVVQCLQQVEKNGFSLSIPAVREGLLLAIRRTAREAETEWDAEETAKALKRAEVVVGHMEHPEHCGSRKVTDQDPRADPYVIAVPCELAARLALDGARQDVLAKVELYSTRLISALAQQKTALDETAPWQIEENLPQNIKTQRLVEAHDRLIAKFIPVRNALKLALQIRGNNWPEEERAFAAHLQQQIEQKLDLAVEESGKRNVEVNSWEENAAEEWKATRGS